MQLPDRQDFGMLIHTALRKVCDSKITSIAYNLIHACDQEWILFLDVLYDNLEKHKAQNLVNAVREVVRKMQPIEDLDPLCERPERELVKEIDKNLFTALVLTMNEFDLEDWERALAYREPEEES